MMLSSSEVWVYAHHPVSLRGDPTFSGSDVGSPGNGITFSISHRNVFDSPMLLNLRGQAWFKMVEKRLLGAGEDKRETLQVLLNQGRPILWPPLPWRERDRQRKRDAKSHELGWGTCIARDTIKTLKDMLLPSRSSRSLVGRQNPHSSIAYITQSNELL